MFIEPIRKGRSQSGTEPDAQPITNEQARSAILFGPPGTCKTFLCGCVAAAVGWQYIEVHASHFVAGGLPEVQKTADDIFNRLMELDHAVVLFDEIDELVREREKEHDAFGRFLTTSMLPKLAKLWHQRKVLYFVATNHIQYFDSAITRPERFDALILVGTPSYDAKVRKVEEDLAEQVSISVKPRLADCRAQVEDAFKQAANEYGKRDAQLPSELNLAKFALLRFDQLTQLALLLKEQGAFSETQPEISPDRLRDCLSRIKDQRLRTYAPYMDFGRDQKYVQRDCRTAERLAS
jgi:SpoVK/Ycf46/Vps4 family AAA+-type ATPase